MRDRSQRLHWIETLIGKDRQEARRNNALVIPRGMSVPAYLATRLNYWEGQYASTGFSNKRLKGIHVLDHYVSMAEYEANRDAR